MEVLAEWLARFDTFLPVWARIGGFVAAMPVLARRVPVIARAGFSLLLAALLYPVVALPRVPPELFAFSLMIGRELMVGLAIGFISGLIFTAAYVSGQLIDFPIGFGLASVFDPEGALQLPVVAQFQYVIATLVFLLINGHHALLRALAQSFRAVPVDGAAFSGLTLGAAVEGVAGAFALGLQIAFPILAALFLTDLALGIVARAVPQVNVFIVGFPVKITVGIALVALVLPAYIAVLAWAFGPGGRMMEDVARLLRSLAP